MKSFIGSITISLIVIIAISESMAVTVCPVNCNTNSNTNVCGISTTYTNNIKKTTCRRFSNDCNRKLFNCVKNKSFTYVALSRCRDITVGNSGNCRPATSTNTVSSPTVSVLNSLNGINGLNYGSSTPSVTPIVIRV